MMRLFMRTHIRNILKYNGYRDFVEAGDGVEAVEKYLQEIGKIHVLTPEEEADLAKGFVAEMPRPGRNWFWVICVLLFLLQNSIRITV